jgi:hypothetical protein
MHLVYSVLHPPHPANRSVAGERLNLLFASTGGSTTFTIGNVLEESRNRSHISDNDRLLSKCPALSSEGEVVAKRAALGVLDINTRQSSCSEKGKNKCYQHRE